MSSRAPPKGFSEWRHIKSRQQATFLAVAKGVGPDNGVDFAYFLAPTSTGGLQARVMRMDLWWDNMELVRENADPYNLRGDADDGA